MTQEIVLALGLLVLAFLSGMLGLGVAFAAIPFLSFFLEDLVHQVQPLALLLNGLTALLSTLGFARSGYVDWRAAVYLAAVTTFAVVAMFGVAVAGILHYMRHGPNQVPGENGKEA